ncbi:MAG: class I SAM-dependent methyltransferase, partial [Opitutaceae bacterium]|nr:class I SAM-dependent methyltransferase [Opitutaceae bacterium]
MAAVEDDMWYYRALHARVWRSLRDSGLSATAHILDAGCGTGGLIKRLGPLMSSWTWMGVDVHPAACVLARERVGVTIAQADLTRLPFGDEGFDAVVSADVIYHIEDDQRALAEMGRVLRPGGLLVINVPAYRWLWSYHDAAVQSCRRYGRWELRAKLQA